MKLIDKDKVVAELERRIGELFTLDKASYEIGLYDAYKIILSFLDTLEVKEVDLEKEFYDFLDTLIGKDNGHLSEDELFRIAEYFFELGLKAKKGE